MAPGSKPIASRRRLGRKTHLRERAVATTECHLANATRVCRRLFGVCMPKTKLMGGCVILSLFWAGLDYALVGSLMMVMPWRPTNEPASWREKDAIFTAFSCLWPVSLSLWGSTMLRLLHWGSIINLVSVSLLRAVT